MSQTVILALLAGVVAAAPPPAVPSPQVAVLLSFQNRAVPDLVEQVRREVDGIFSPAGLTLVWQSDPPGFPPGPEQEIVRVEMRGNCRLSLVEGFAAPFRGRAALGWTRIHNGRVLPESAVECDQIARAMQSLSHQVRNRALLQRLYIKLVGRVMAHELMHALLRTADHHLAFNLEAPLRPADLLEPVRLLPFQIAALQQAHEQRFSGPMLAGKGGSPLPAGS